MPRYAPTMPQADLRQMIIDKAVANNYIEEYGDLDPANPDMFRLVHMLLMEELVNEVEKDWGKIDFSTENMDVTAEKVTPGGVPYLQIRAGGDWESPLVCILYFDGKKLRGYVPKDGNTYNHRTKAAFGNNDSDAADGLKQFGSRYDDSKGYVDVEPDFALLEQDIAKRIEAKGTYSHQQGKVVSKAKVRAAEQARIEKDQDLTGPITADMVYAVISPAAGCSYVEFKLRSSKRMLTLDEGARITAIPSQFRKPTTPYGNNAIWYAPMGCYPMETLALLEAAGFVKAPDNDLTPYQGARTVIIS